MKLLNKNLIFVDVELNDKDEVIQKIGEIIEKEKRSNDIESLKQDIYKRESEASTSMGWGVAIPHAQTSHITEPSLIFMRSENPISWNEDKVEMVFGILVPSEGSDVSHLSILASLARKLVNEDFRKTLLESVSKDAIYDVLNTIAV